MSNISDNYADNCSLCEAAPLVISVLHVVDRINRVTALIIFMVYFTLVALVSDLRKVTFFYVHHLNLVGFFFILMYMFFFDNVLPSFDDEAVDNVLCSMAELAWSMLKYMRAYTILNIAVKRCIQVYSEKLFNTLNHSASAFLLQALCIWLCALLLSLTTKFAFHTSYGYPFCIDGSTRVFHDRLGYFIVDLVASLTVPFAITTSCYFVIARHLSRRSRAIRATMQERKKRQQVTFIRLRYCCVYDTLMVANSELRHERLARRELRRNGRLNRQLMLLNLAQLVCFAASLSFSFRFIVSDFSVKAMYAIQMLRILNIFSQSLIPVITIYYGPAKSRQLAGIFARLRQQCQARRKAGRVTPG